MEPVMSQSLINRIKKNSKIEGVDLVSTSKILNEREVISTPVPILNLILNGKFNGGLESGVTTFAGPSKHFKSMMGVLCIAAFQRKYKDGVCVFYDTEFGTSREYFEQYTSIGVDISRILHCPVKSTEDIIHDLPMQLDDFEKDDRVMIYVDSIGNMASKKEREDAVKKESKEDMTRAKKLKALFRMITSTLVVKGVPMVAINHVYQTQEMFSKQVMSGGTGIYLASDNIIFMGRQQIKDTKTNEIVGWNFIMNSEKSRCIQEKLKFSFEADYKTGVNRWSGLFELGLKSGHIVEVTKGYYSRRADIVPDDKKWRKAATNTIDFWRPLIKESDFTTAVEHSVALQNNSFEDIGDFYTLDEL
jgi:RecA/RadA recombinase